MTELIRRAAAFAEAAHTGQTRKGSDTPYIEHPRRVSELVRAIGGTEAQIAAAWLHDVVEDCDVTLDDVREAFGEEVAALVDALTDKHPPGPGTTRAERKANEARRIGRSPAAARLVKACDILDNAFDLGDVDAGFQRKWMAEKAVMLAAMREFGKE